MLPPVYSQRGLLLTHVPFRERVYFRGDFNQTPTAIAKIDQGYLCLLAKKVLKARISSWLCAVACRGKFSWQRMAEKSEGVFTDVFFLNYNKAFAWQDELFMHWHIRNTAG